MLRLWVPVFGIENMTIIATDEEGQSTRLAKSMMADCLNHSSAFPQPSDNCGVEHKTVKLESSETKGAHQEKGRKLGVFRKSQTSRVQDTCLCYAIILQSPFKVTENYGNN